MRRLRRSAGGQRRWLMTRLSFRGGCVGWDLQVYCNGGRAFQQGAADPLDEQTALTDDSSHCRQAC